MRHSSLASALARSFLAGDQSLTELIARGAATLGHRWRWLRPVAQRYVDAFAGQTRPRHRDVVALLAKDPDFQRALLKYPRRLSVERWLAEPQSMAPVAAAREWELPPIESVGALAEWLSLDTGKLEWFADLKGLGYKKRVSELRHYHYKILAKRSGRIRLIEAPKPRLKGIQRQILEGILEKIPAHEVVHGFVRGRSIRTFVAPHAGQCVVLRMDLQDFFPSFAAARIQTVFRTFGYPETTSPALANIAAYRLDCRLAGLAKAAGAVYTRYADDLAFSGGEEWERGVERFSTHVAAFLHEEDFAVHHRKTRIMRQGVRQHPAGLVANRKVNVIRADFDRLKAVLTNCVRQGPASQNREGHPDFRAHLAGRVGFVEMINPDRGRRLRWIFEQIKWP